MITQLAALGLKYRLQFVLEYELETVTVAVIYSLKSTDLEDAVPKTLSFSGSLAEVEEALVNELPKAIEKLSAHANALEALDVQLAAEKAEKESETKKERDAKEVARKEQTERLKKDSPKPKKAAPPPPVPAGAAGLTPELRPAWKPKDPAPDKPEADAPDFGSLFDEPTTT